MNTVVTSREAILKICRELVSQQGLAALNMREVAQECHVALGSLYNYFPSKNELLLATIESVWQDIFHLDQPCGTALSFPAEVRRVFDSLQTGMVAYPNFFTAHSIGFASGDKGRARQTMEQYFHHMKGGLLEALQRDPAVRRDAFDQNLTPSEFVEFVLSGLLSLLMQRKRSCAVLLEIIRRSLY
ncbi:MAG: TetR/AcrR family transcriptional regulator [Oscillibacter sp.]